MEVSKCAAYVVQPYGADKNATRCFATKELDYCSCNGNSLKCDFYPQLKNKALNRFLDTFPCDFISRHRLVERLVTYPSDLTMREVYNIIREMEGADD